jgi:bifunctional non-homologous end joining protein LigD
MKRYERGRGRVLLHEARPLAAVPDRAVSIEHQSANVIDFPLVRIRPLLWWNLGCIDPNQWYARCDDVDRPDYVLRPRPVKGKPRRPSRVSARRPFVRDDQRRCAWRTLDLGVAGIHVYVPIV